MKQFRNTPGLVSIISSYPFVNIYIYIFCVLFFQKLFAHHFDVPAWRCFHDPSAAAQMCQLEKTNSSMNIGVDVATDAADDAVAAFLTDLINI